MIIAILKDINVIFMDVNGIYCVNTTVIDVRDINPKA